jgi:hypothetical protein
MPFSVPMPVFFAVRRPHALIAVLRRPHALIAVLRRPHALIAVLFRPHASLPCCAGHQAPPLLGGPGADQAPGCRLHRHLPHLLPLQGLCLHLQGPGGWVARAHRRARAGIGRLGQARSTSQGGWVGGGGAGGGRTAHKGWGCMGCGSGAPGFPPYVNPCEKVLGASAVGREPCISQPRAPSLLQVQLSAAPPCPSGGIGACRLICTLMLWFVGMCTPKHINWSREGDSRQPMSGGGTLCKSRTGLPALPCRAHHRRDALRRRPAHGAGRAGRQAARAPAPAAARGQVCRPGRLAPQPRG